MNLQIPKMMDYLKPFNEPLSCDQDITFIRSALRIQGHLINLLWLTQYDTVGWINIHDPLLKKNACRIVGKWWPCCSICPSSGLVLIYPPDGGRAFLRPLKGCWGGHVRQVSSQVFFCFFYRVMFLLYLHLLRIFCPLKISQVVSRWPLEGFLNGKRPFMRVDSIESVLHATKGTLLILPLDET